MLSAALRAIASDGLVAAGPLLIPGDARQLGLATLIAVGAIVFGIMVSRIWPRFMNPVLFGWLASAALLGALTYMGVETAGFVLLLLIGVAVLIGILALVFN